MRDVWLAVPALVPRASRAPHASDEFWAPRRQRREGAGRRRRHPGPPTPSPTVTLMSEHHAHIRWQHDGGSFAKRQYSRAHTWTFDGGATVPASSAPSGVPVPYSDPAAVDPEEAFVAAVSSCHMLSFLFVAANAGFAVRRYEDDAVGRMTRNADGALWVSDVELAPRIAYDAAAAPTSDEEADLHHRAHEACYIANSVRTAITVRGATPRGGAAH